jgi:predicted DNA-binding transcriptional regulator AlpA
MTPRRLLLNVHEASEITGIQPKRLYDRAQQGLIPGVVRIGRSVRFSLPAILKWLQAEESESEGVRSTAISDPSHK